MAYDFAKLVLLDDCDLGRNRCPACGAGRSGNPNAKEVATTAFYGTADEIAQESGGGHVTANELQALRELSGDVVVAGHQELYNLLLNLPNNPFLADYMMAHHARLALDRGKPGLAHFYSGTCTQTVALFKAHGVPLTYTSPAHDRHTTMEEHFRMGLDYPFAHIRDDNLWAVFKRGLLEADIVIAPSRASATFLAAEGCQRLEVIPHGCVPPKQTPPLPQEFRVGFLGQCGPDKGVVYLLQAWSKLAWPRTVLALAGPGTDQLSPLIGRVSSQGQFKLLGRVASPSDFYATLSVYCAPSVCESFGITVLEAMAHGRPVIASEGAGVSELVTEGVDGFVVPRRSPDAIAERLAWFKANPHKIVPMGQAAREKALGYTWEKIRAQYQDVWRALLT